MAIKQIQEMFCVVLAHPSWDAIFKQIERAKPYTELFELRLDALENLSFEPLRELLKLPYKFICTFRAFEEGGYKKVAPLSRWKILEEACSLGAYLVDFEWKSFLKIKNQLLQSPYFPEKVLFSYHNFKVTPPLRTLKNSLKKASGMGAKWFKVTTYTESLSEALEVLKLIEYGKELGLGVVAFSMGEKVRLSRILNILLGAPFTYVFLPSEKPLAPGQMDVLYAKKVWEVLKGV